MHQGVLQRLVHHTWRTYPSPASRLLLLEECHLAHCHVGAAKLYDLLRPAYWWPAMEDTCRSYVAACFACQLEKATHTSSRGWRGELIAPPPGPRLEWVMDLLVDLPVTSTGARHVLAMVDPFSKFVLFFPLRHKSAAAVLPCL